MGLLQGESVSAAHRWQCRAEASGDTVQPGKENAAAIPNELLVAEWWGCPDKFNMDGPTDTQRRELPQPFIGSLVSQKAME